MKFNLTVIFFLINTVIFSQVPPNRITHDDISQKIKSLASDIAHKQRPNGSWVYGKHVIGATALHLLALSSAQLPPDNPAIKKGTEYLLQNFPIGDVYSMGLYAAALQKINHIKYKNEISKAASWLIETQKNGTWNYKGNGSGDNSVTQFALIGLKAAMDAGILIPKTTLEASRNHFINTQNDDGGWGYSGKSSSRGSMTCAALASLSICKLEECTSMELKKGPRFCGVYNFESSIKKGLSWLTREFKKDNSKIFSEPYTAYACERAGIFFDKKKFGEFDWFKLGASQIINSRNNKGKYLPEAFKLLFLAKGNSPILINKVKWGRSAEWNRRRNDVRNITKYFSATLKQDLDWQQVNLDLNDRRLAQAPILYLSGLKELLLPKNELHMLKKYVDDGGTVILSPCLKSKAFVNSSLMLIQSIYPEAKFVKIPPTHKLRRTHFNLQTLNIPLKILKNNCAFKKIFITTEDLSLEFEAKKIPKISKYTLINLIKFSVGEKPLVAKLEDRVFKNPEIENKKINFQDSKGSSEEGIDIAQVIHSQNTSTINPATMNNMLGFMRKNLGIPTKSGIDLIYLKDLDSLSQKPIIYLTGQNEFTLTKLEKNNLKKYLENGGFLFADSGCSCSEFDLSFRKLIKELFPGDLKKIFGNNPIYDIPYKYDMQFTKELLKTKKANEVFLEGIQINERLSVVYSPYDFSSALSGQIDEDAKGIKVNSALKLVSNIISYGLSY